MTRPWVRWAGPLGVGVLLVIAAPGATFATTPVTPDTAVTTRDGAVYQGSLVEQVPSDHITIQTADGKIHTFNAGQVVSVRPLGARQAVEQIAAPSQGSSGVLVDLTATDPNARLVQLSVSGNGAPAPNAEICGPPCGMRVSPGTYLIGGAGIVPSPAFGLSESAAHVRVTSDPVTLDHRSTSLMWAAGGGIGASVGLSFWLAGALFESNENDFAAMGGSPPPNIGAPVKWTGIVLTAVSLVAGIAGLVMWYQADTTARVEPVGP
jgi:hypothetical protein